MESFSDRNIKKTYALPLGDAVKTFQYMWLYIYCCIRKVSN